MKTSSRNILFLCIISMSMAYFFSVWKIELEAPQYPEGLKLEIWVNGLKGDVASINNLNHYIGMAHLDNDTFWEFRVLPWLLAFMIFSGLLMLWSNRRKALAAYFIFLLIIAVVASYDFWRWEYEYGHNLDPMAAIKIPGMAYQPPFIGYKELLNFLAGSLPDTGAWFIIIPACIIGLICYYECFVLYRKEKLKT